MKDWKSTSWSTEDGSQKITIEQVLADHKDTPVEELYISDVSDLLTVQCDPARVDRANMEYPVLVLYHDDSFVCILDGHHRIHKALKQGLETIPAIIVKNYAPLYKVFD